MPQPRAIVPDGAVRPGRNAGTTDIPTATIVRLSAVDTVAASTAASDEHFGVTMHTVKAGAVSDIQIAGKAIVRAGAALATVGTWVTSDATGRAVAATIDAASVARLVGKTASVASAADQLVEVELAITVA